MVVFPIVSGCGPTEPDPSAAVAKAGKALDRGDTQGAIDILQAYEERKPGNPQIVEQLAFDYSQKGDLKKAAYYFGRLAEVDPARPDALLFAAKNLQQAGDFQGAMITYQQYLAKKPEDIDASLAFAALAADNSRVDAAIGQYTYVYGLKPSADVAVNLGDLYLRKADMQQASLWFGKAKDDNPQAYDLGMLEVAMRSQNYPKAEKLISQIRKDYPGALEASSVKDAPDTIQRWHERLDAEKKAAADAVAAEKKRQEDEAAKPKIEIIRADGTSVKPGETAALAPAAQPAPAPVTQPSTAAERRMSKEQAVAAEEAREDRAEALASGNPAAGAVALPSAAQAPANSAPSPTVQAAPLSPDAANIVAKPAPSPEAMETREAAPKSGAQPAPEILKPVARQAPAPAPVVEKTAETKPAPAPVAKPSGPSSVEMLANARKAAKEGHLDDAVKLYQAFLARYSNAQVWNEFSAISMQTGNPGQALAASLEATRLAPYNLDFAVQYLSVAEKVYDQRRVMSEILVMKKRFPESPVITLALARAYWQVEGNAGLARYYYDEYLDHAPKNSPLDDIRRERDAIPLP